MNTVTRPSAGHRLSKFSIGTWPAYGIPELLAVDNGLDLTSFGVREACSALGTDLLYTPPRAPWYKANAERMGKTLNTRLIHWLPGTTLGRATADLGYNGADYATLTFDAFEELLVQYITTIHNKTPRSGKPGSPEQLFLRGCQVWPVRVPASQDEFDAACALTRTSVLRQTGLHFLDLQYQNDELGRLFNRSPARTRLTYKVNPLDLKVIQVRHPASGSFFPVVCVSDYEWPRTLALHMAVRVHAKSLGLSAADKSDLARAHRDLMAKLTEAASTSKRALRRMQAELLRQNQSLAEDASESVPNPNADDDLIGDVFEDVYSQ